MKKLINIFNMIIPLLLLQVNLFAQDDNDRDNKPDKKYDFVKTKNVNRSYNVSSNDKLSIDNEFGKVEVHTWDRNEMKVDVSIEVSATREDLAQRIIDGITISDAQSGRNISFKTTIKGRDKNKGSDNESKNEKSSMHVNYSISMPAINPLHVANSFGSTTIPDIRGEVELSSKFGSLTTGSLSNIKSIEVEFGKASFQNLTNGMITVKFSKAEFLKLSGNIKLNLEFCGPVKVNMDNSLTGIDIKASYSKVNLRPSADMSASYSISTNFGSLKNNTTIKFDNDEDDNKGVKFDHIYTGRSGSGTVPIKVKTEFNSVILGEPGPDDMKDKEKRKSKSRTS